jgi:hypothetical protein
MSEDNQERKIGIEYVDKLRKTLQKQKKKIHGMDQNFKFNPKYVKAKPNVPKNITFKRSGLIAFPFIATKLLPKATNRNVVADNTITKSLNASTQNSFDDTPDPPRRAETNFNQEREVGVDCLEKWRKLLQNRQKIQRLDQKIKPTQERRMETFVNSPTGFFTEQEIPRNFSIFKPDVQLTAYNNTIETATSAIFKPPVTSTPFNLDENTNVVDLGEENYDQFSHLIPDEPSNIQAEFKTTPPRGPSDQDLRKYSIFVGAFSKAAADSDKLTFQGTRNEYKQAKEYLLKILKYTAPSPSTTVVQAIKQPCRKQTTDNSLFDLFATPNSINRESVLSETVFESPNMTLLTFTEQINTHSDSFELMFGVSLCSLNLFFFIQSFFSFIGGAEK